ncbi:serine/threonine-protein kinase [Polyangium mundeleinium]|uniref:Serine/threonine-protein kinase n=1 Tax=Polyangium mundeleinium TaxID=2995306 RepID=A0ABT5F021_9BACT|nr:serine/threonine-protein kinase [Polyangium mundeleinium]MDC0746979.1 serine/threonine-protein kinase [Polyangium mundeleinium]
MAPSGRGTTEGALVEAMEHPPGTDAPPASSAEDPVAFGPKLLDHTSLTSEDPTLIETPSMAGVRRTTPPPSRVSLPPSSRISLPPVSVRTGRISAPGRISASPSILRPTTAGYTMAEALHTEEAARASAFGRVIVILCAFGVVSLPLAPDTIIRLPFSVALVAMGSVGAWVWWRGKDEARYTHRVLRIFVGACLLMMPMTIYYLGVFSPAPLLVTLAFSVFGMSDDRRFMYGAAGVAISLYFVLAILVGTGLLPDVGLFRATDAAPNARLFMTLYVPSVLAIAAWQTRTSRVAAIEAMKRSVEASRLAAQREAQLDEAHLILERALRAGAGLDGRHTGAIAGGYCLAELIGRGAMGEVYAAAHVDTGERAAVKLLSAAGLENPALVERFLREGEISQRLASPHVVSVFAVGATNDGAPFIAMELLEGKDLAHHLRQEKQLDLARVTELLEQVARGLSAAHAASIVHRDLKPQNLFLSQADGGASTWKILDFGVSKLQGSKGTLTQAAVVGTPGYMSPEQAQGIEADVRSDLFSLGAVAYRALTGRPPFSGTDTPQILFEIVYKTPARASDIVPNLPRDVDLVLALALAKKPADRFSSAEAFASAFTLASRGKLPSALREKGRALVAKYPWGKAITERESRDTRTSRAP